MFYNFELESLKYLSYIFVPYTPLNIQSYALFLSISALFHDDLVFEVSEQRMVA